MSSRTYTVTDLAQFDAVIDARSPAEYAVDHIPGAVNCPVLTDEERVIVGATYVQLSPFAARKIGGAMVARNIAGHLDTWLAGQGPRWRPLVYCWRGGMRSGSFVKVLRLVGWDAQQLKGGYKSWRHHVVDQLPALSQALSWRVLCGPTGSAKTRVLQALARDGAQVLDLEGLAAHRGSVLGEVPELMQPSQKAFETHLFSRMAAFDPGQPVWIEAESRRIGRLTVPDALSNAMHASPLVEIVASMEARVNFLLRDYAWLVRDPEALGRRLSALKGLLPNLTLAQWQAWALAGERVPLITALLGQHYDPLYARSMGRQWLQRGSARRIETDDLSPAGVDALAARVALLR